MSTNTQLTSAIGYDTKKMIFSAPQQGSISNTGGGPEIKYKRISISTENPDKTVGDLIIPTTKVFSFGVSENTNLETGKVNGYVMPLCLHNRDGASKEEKQWSDTFNNIVERCKEHLVENRNDIEMYDLELRDLKKLNPLYYKKEKGVIVEGFGPTLYAKLLVSKKKKKKTDDDHNKIVTMFFNFDGESVDPLTLLGKYCNAKAAIKIESIFIGNKISLQVKLYECEVELMDTGMKRLLKRPDAQQRVLTSHVSRPLEEKDDNNESDVGSLKDSDSDQDDIAKESDIKKSSDKKVVKRRVKKVVRKTANSSD